MVIKNLLNRENCICLTCSVLERVLKAIRDGDESVRISPDLNLSEVEIPLESAFAEIGGKRFSRDELKALAEKTSGVILVREGETRRLEFYKEHYYKLRPTEFAPTVEIDGIQMHRTRDFNPWEDARRKAKLAVRPGDTVLDTCGGLGYTAIWAARLGASSVVSVEKDRNIVELRELNPHSREFFHEPVISIAGDISEIILDFSPGEFDSVIHDPPRFSLAGELYGGNFYRELSRALRKGGRMFHYTGEPYSRGRGRRFVQGVMERLKSAGFEVEHLAEELGVTARKRGLE